MSYHVIFSLPEAAIWEGSGKDADSTFDTFEDAKSAAISDLEHWIDKIQGNLAELRAAKTLTDLSYHKHA